MQDDFEDDDGMSNGTLAGKITEENKNGREYVVYRYRWWYENRCVSQHARSFRIEDYGSRDAAKRAAEREQIRHCEDGNLRYNDYRIDGNIVVMKLCLFTANVPSQDYVTFDLDDLELIKKQRWFHDELKGVVYCTKGTRRSMAAYIHYNGTIPRYVRQQFHFKDKDWRNNQRANLHNPRQLPVSENFLTLYTDLLNGRHPAVVGVEDNKFKRYKLHWSEQGKKRQKYFSFKQRSRSDTQDDMKIFIINHCSELLEDDESSDSDSDPQIAYLKYVQNWRDNQ